MADLGQDLRMIGQSSQDRPVLKTVLIFNPTLLILGQELMGRQDGSVEPALAGLRRRHFGPGHFLHQTMNAVRLVHLVYPNQGIGAERLQHLIDG